MSNLLCPFSGPLIKQDFGCQYAEEIIRRGGTEIACRHGATHTLCCALHTVVKQSALLKMDLEDDLLQVPHNVLLRIQYGGLLGLQSLMDETAATDKVVDNATLVISATEKYGGVENIRDFQQNLWKTIFHHRFFHKEFLQKVHEQIYQILNLP